MSSPAVSGRRRNRDWLHMDDTVAASDAPAAGSRLVRVLVPLLVNGEMTYYELEYELPRLHFDDNHLRRMFREQREMDLAYDVEDRKRARAAASSDDAIRRCLRVARAGDAGMPEDCAVCLQDFDASAKETLRVMPSCSHAFHPDCIFSWLRVKTVCPLCRQGLPTQQDKDQDFEDEDDSDEDSDEESDEDDSDSDEDDTDVQSDDQQESTPAVPEPEEP